MKNLVAIPLLFCIINGVAAQTVGEKIDTVKTSWSEIHKKYNSPLFVLDGAVLDSTKLDDIDLNEILDINILTHSPDKSFALNRTSDVVIITTKKSAKTQYQKKLSQFSNDYKIALESHKNKDDNFLYVINNAAIQGEPDHVTYTLFHLADDEILNVRYIEKGISGDDSVLSPMVIIKTKQ